MNQVGHLTERTPLLPQATQTASALHRRSRALARTAERRTLHDQAGLLALGGVAAIYSRQFFSTWVTTPQWAIAGLALKSGAAVANATVGRYATKDAHTDAIDVRPRGQLPWRCVVPAALAGARLLACPIGEAPAMVVGFALHFAEECLPEDARASRRALAWSALGAYLLVREMMFAHVALPRALANYDLPRPVDALSCNGQGAICEKRWCDTVFPATHNAGALSVPFAKVPTPFNQLGRFASNQDRTLEEQFNDGIRGFLLEYYRDVHGTLIGSHNVYWNFELMVRTFTRLRKLVEQRPRDLMVLKMSPQGDMGDMWELVQDALDGSGLSRYMRASRPSCDHTVGALLDEGVRVIAFDRDFSETCYSARNVGEITCDALQPWEGGPNSVPVTLNAFSTYAFQPASDAVNAHLTQVFDGCRNALRDNAFVPTLLAVNHYETSLVVPMAYALNGNLTLPQSTPSHRAMLVGFAQGGAAASALMFVLGAAMLSLLSRFTWLRPRQR